MKNFVTILFVFIVGSFSSQLKAQGTGEALYAAVVNNDTAQVRMLLDGGADANYIKEQGFVKVSCLITAVNNDNPGSVRMLLEHKAQVDWRDGFNTTALIYAANKGNPLVVTMLLDAGADPAADDGDGNTPLKSAKTAEIRSLIQARLDAKK